MTRMYPRGGLASMGRTASYGRSNVPMIIHTQLNQLYIPPEGKRLLGRDEMTFARTRPMTSSSRARSSGPQ